MPYWHAKRNLARAKRLLFRTTWAGAQGCATKPSILNLNPKRALAATGWPICCRLGRAAVEAEGKDEGQEAENRTCLDAQKLYVAFSVPAGNWGP